MNDVARKVLTDRMVLNSREIEKLDKNRKSYLADAANMERRILRLADENGAIDEVVNAISA